MSYKGAGEETIIQGRLARASQGRLLPQGEHQQG